MPLTLYLGGVDGLTATQAALAGVCDVEHVVADNDALAAAIAPADALLDASMKVPITKSLLAAAENLKIISTATTGSDHIDHVAAAERGVALHTLKNDTEVLQNITPAAELSWTLVLACARRLTGAVKHVHDGEWVRESFPGMMLNGRSLGLVGCGRIGGWMARYAHAFGMHVRAFDPHRTELPAGVEAATLDHVMTDSDVISVHVHMSDDTRGLIDQRLFASIKPGAIFINTSRGGVIDEEALLEGLRSGRVGAAGLDVLQGEPETANHPLVAYARANDNLLITPHCGGYSPDAVRVVCAHAAKKIATALGH